MGARIVGYKFGIDVAGDRINRLLHLEGIEVRLQGDPAQASSANNGTAR